VGGAGSQKREQVLRREQGSRVNRVSSFFLESGGKDENEWTGALIGPEPK
jgi:hypothetical protein